MRMLCNFGRVEKALFFLLLHSFSSPHNFNQVYNVCLWVDCWPCVHSLIPMALHAVRASQTDTEMSERERERERENGGARGRASETRKDLNMNTLYWLNGSWL